MAYKKNFNPDALPAHAQPEEAAQAMSHLHLHQKPSSNNNNKPSHSPNGQPRPPPKSPPDNYRRPHNTPPNNNSYSQQAPPNSRPNHNNRVFSPPPPGQGWGPRPDARPPVHQSQHQYNTQQNYNYPPAAPIPPSDPDSSDLFSYFVAANTSKTGSLTRAELGAALVNADSTHFDPLTIRSLVQMFSSSPSGQPQGPTITYPEFQNLWRFLAAWRELFERFDEDHSGKISLDEFSNALAAFGYRLSAPFVTVVYNAYGGQGGERRPSTVNGKGMSFDLFVQACINLKRMTDVFKGYDDDRDGYISLSFEEFLTEIIRLRD